LTVLDVRERALHLCGFALEKKAVDLVLLDVAEHTSIADYFIICSGRSDRQVQSIAQGLQEGALQDGFKPIAAHEVAETATLVSFVAAGFRAGVDHV
jgi:ribosome-associated protein